MNQTRTEVVADGRPYDLDRTRGGLRIEGPQEGRSVERSGFSSGNADASNGRFVACRAGFYDPAIFEAGREVTFIGHIDGYETTKIGDYDYKLPKLAADIVYLWPVVQQNRRAYPDPWEIGRAHV